MTIEMKSKVLGVIPARAGSKVLKRKSLLPLGGLSLIARATKEAKKSKYLDRVIFSSDDVEMMNEAEINGGEVLFSRPQRLADDYTSSWAVVLHAVDWLEKNEKWVPDYICLLQPTTPFRTSQHIDEAFAKMLNEKKTSCISAKEVDYPPHWMFTMDEDNKPSRFFPNGKNIKRRQDAPLALQPNGLIYIIKRNLLSADLSLPLNSTAIMKMDPEISINIDTAIQYGYAKFIFENL